MTVRTIFNDDPTKFKFDEVKNTLAKEWNEEPESIDNDDVWDRIYNEIDWTFDDEFNNLDIKTENDIIAIASMGLWNGRRSGYKLLNRRNLNEIMICGNEDYNHLYYDGFKNKKTGKVIEENLSYYIELLKNNSNYELVSDKPKEEKNKETK